jgi:hypothetical protein
MSVVYVVGAFIAGATLGAFAMALVASGKRRPSWDEVRDWEGTDE